MQNEVIINWPGISGRIYQYRRYIISTKMNSVPANYIFAKLVGGIWHPIYIGETSNLKERLEKHHKMDCVIKNGATHIFTHRSSYNEDERINEETDLRRKYKTTCNDQ